MSLRAVIYVLLSQFAVYAAANNKEKFIICGADEKFFPKTSANVCYWTELNEDGEAIFNTAGFSVEDLITLRWCSKEPPNARAGKDAEAFWAECTDMFPIANRTEECTANCLKAYCADCDDGQTLYQIYAARLCLASRKCHGTSVSLNLPGGLNEEHCALTVLDDGPNSDNKPGHVCLPWFEECADQWYNCVSDVPQSIRGDSHHKKDAIFV